jgi:hypothetical protein
VEGRVEGARDLVLAIFRLAVCDYLGLSYGHDQPGRPRRVCSVSTAEAALFLTSAWAGHLAELAGFHAELVWREAGAMKLTKQEAIGPVPSIWTRAA